MKKGEVWVVMERGGERRLEARIDKASRAPSVIAAAIDNGSIVGGDHVFVVKVLRSGVIGPKVPKPRKPPKPKLGLVVDDGG
jgi:hypothetical protein